jgi:hypothetical protein
MRKKVSAAGMDRHQVRIGIHMQENQIRDLEVDIDKFG